MNIEILHKGQLAKTRLYHNIIENNIVPSCDIIEVLNEFTQLLFLFTKADRWKCAMADIHNNIWKLAILDTYHYKDLCNYVCYINELPQHFIHYEPNINFGIDTLVKRKLYTYTQFNTIYNKQANIKYWKEIETEINNIDVNINIINIITNESKQLKFNKYKVCTDLYTEVAKLFDASVNDIKLICNGEVVNCYNILNHYLTNNTTFHLLIRS